MTDSQRAPALDRKQAMILRFVAIGIAYGLYRLFSEGGLVTGILVGVGVLLVEYASITRWSTRSGDRSELMLTGQTILGVVFAALGVFRFMVNN